MSKSNWHPNEGVDLVTSGLNTAHESAKGAANALVVGGVLFFAVAIILGSCLTPFAILFVMFAPSGTLWDIWARPPKYERVNFEDLGGKRKMSKKQFDKKFGAFIFNARCKAVFWLFLTWIISVAIYAFAVHNSYGG